VASSLPRKVNEMSLSSGFHKVWRGSAAVLVSLALGFGYLSVEALPARADGTTVTINDAGFAACLDAALSDTDATFDVAALNAITTLDCSNRGIASLAGAENLTAATSLNFANNAIRGVEALSGLYGLTDLNIANNHIADISPLASLEPDTFDATGQTLSWVIQVGVETAIPVSGVWGSPAMMASSNTERLAVADGKATGLAAGIETPSIAFSDDALGTFSGTLTTKIVPGYSFEEIPDAGLASCLEEKLGVVHGSLFDLTALRAVTSLNCDNRNIRDLTGVIAIEYATSLSFANNDIYTLLPLDGMPGTHTLNVSGNHITDVSRMGIEFAAGLNATNQTASWSLAPNAATAIPLISFNGVAPTNMVSSDPALTFSNGQATAANAGTFAITFTATSDASSFSGTLTTIADAEDPVSVPDQELAACLDARLNVSGSMFRAVDLAKITGTLDCSHRSPSITDLTGAGALVYVTDLNLSGNNISNTTPLTGLTRLTSLNLSSNKLTGVAPLATATGLKDLNVSNNQILDVSPLGSLALTTLNATSQTLKQTVAAGVATDVAIRDLAGELPTFTLPSGVTVDAVNKQLTATGGTYDIAFSSGSDPIVFSGSYALGSQMDVEITQSSFAACVATSLNKPASTRVFSNLDLAGIPSIACPRQSVTSIDGAQYMTNLVYFDISGNVVSDVSPLAGLKVLATLDLRDNQISDISALSGLTSVQNLYLSGNVLSSLSALSGLTHLVTLDVSENDLTSLTGIEAMTLLVTLNASSNQLTGIAPVKTLARLTTLNLSDNQLTSLTDLASLPTGRLKSLTIDRNQITSISTLSRFTNLATVRASGNKVADLTPLAALSRLLIVDFSNNKISSLSVLAGHPALVAIYASGNQLTSIDGLTGVPSLSTMEIFDNQIADLTGLAALPALTYVNARNQAPRMTVIPQVATGLALKDLTGAAPTLGTLPAGISEGVDGVKANAEGSYDIPFSSTLDTDTQRVEFSGTLTVVAAYNTFTSAPTPTITGTPKVDSTLTAHPGTWSPEPAFAYQWKSDGVDISGASESTYTLTSAEVGKAITVTMTATKDTYAAVTKTSAATEAVSQATFTAPSDITVTGTFKVGQTVTANAGTWTPSGTITYQWLRAGVAISGATDAAYTLTTADLDRAVSVQVSATLDGYQTGSLRSSAAVVGLGTMVGDKPVIVVDGGGQVAIGKTLNVGTGYWAPVDHFDLQWYRAGYPIEGATGYSYVATAADVGKAITVSQTGSATGYASLTKLSDPTASVPAGSFTAPASISVAGSMAVGQTLTADPGSWTPTPDALTYQWLSDGDAIASATSSTYQLKAADETHVITVRVSAAKTGYTSASVTSTNSTEVAQGSFVAATPVITGAPIFGQTLKAAVDPWSPTANLSWQWLRNGEAINAATGSNYQLSVDDIGQLISVSVTGSLAGYANNTMVSSQTAEVAKATFAAPAEITVDGSLAVGQKLSVDPATWSPTPDAVSYTWLRGGDAIAGATSSSYTLVSADLEEIISLEVRATKAGYTDSTLSWTAGAEVSASVPTADVPTISGNAMVDSTLTAHAGAWSPMPALSYQWLADGVAITDATAATYKVTPADVDTVISVAVTGTLSGYATKTVESDGTAKVSEAELSGPAEVAVSGDFVVGSTLTADAGTWAPDPVAVAYQWLRAGVVINDATTASYLLTAADQGKVVTVKVTAAKAGYRTVTLHSVAVEPVAAASFAAATPTISGTATVDQTLSVTTGTWTPTPATQTIQWKRDGKVIDDATGATYVLGAADAGKAITVSVSGSAEGYANTTMTSKATSVVAKADFEAPIAIAITGTMAVGEFVTANPGTWTPTPDSFSYRWLRDGEAIVGATSTASYLLDSADAGAVVTVEVTATKAGYTPATMASAEGAAVAAGSFAAPTPTISGTTVVDSTLTASAAAWTPSPSQVSYQWLAAGTPVSGATGLTYKIAAGDAGKVITFAVTGTKAGYADTTVTSDATAAVAKAALAGPSSITVAGDLAVGQKLSVGSASWTPTPDSFSYRWLRNGVAIDAATSSSYTLTAADLGKTVTVEVTALKAGYTNLVVSSEAGVAVAASAFAADTPTVGGNAVVDSTLTAHAGTWTPTPATLTYQWKADGSAITDATNSTYTLTAADTDKVITVEVTGTLSGYTTKTAQSAATSKVAQAELAGPADISVSGDFVVGQTLTAAAGTWTPAPVGVTYQWLRAGVAINDATTATYQLTAADQGKIVTVKVTATKAGYRTVTLRSVAADPVAPAAILADIPTITGTVDVGQELSATVGAWTPAPATYSYQWRRAGKAIEDATGATYVITLADVGKAITVSVTGSVDGYGTTTVTSASTIEVPAAILGGPSEITVTGELTVGKKLSADHGTWTPTPDSYSYQWLHDGVEIVDATDSSYTLTATDVDKVITAKVVGAKTGYADLTVASVGGAPVVKGTFSTETPTISGQAVVGSTLTAKPGSWTPTPTSWNYQWLLDGVAIGGATQATYVPVDSDRGKTVTVQIVGARDGYVTSAALQPDSVEVEAPKHFGAPDEIAVNGTYAVGATLTATVGTWTPAPDSYSYQWLRSGSVIPGAQASAYTLVAADAGKVITVKVTGESVGYVAASVRSSAPVAVAAGALSAGQPVISGIPQIGQTLGVSVGSWSPAPSSLSFQWNRSGSPIPGAVGATYQVVAADVWQSITVTVTGGLSGYAQASATSNATVAVPQGVLAGSNPTILGKAKVKKTLTAKIGAWSPAPDVVTYQWYRSGKAIKNATKASYKLVKADKGKKITVKVAVSKVGYATRVVVSKSTAKVKK
jgi:Leucine-rich repeat (LRR) protein